MGIMPKPMRACPSRLDRTFPGKRVVCGLPKGHEGFHHHRSDRAEVKWRDLHNGGASVSTAVFR